jgi:hypothetical protein
MRALLFLLALPLLAAPPGARVLLDAHNCYPYEGRWSGRIDRALSTGLPLAIEQDLYWYFDPASRKAWSVVAHDKPTTGREPTLRDYFFEKVRPLVERELASGDRSRWPVIVLNLDFKTNELEHHAAIWKLLGEYEPWLTTATRTADPAKPQPFDVKPILVLTGDSETQQYTFHDNVPIGARLRLFGAARVKPKSDHTTPPDVIVTEPASNYRRWWNNPWSVVEEGGPPKAGDWTPQDRQRLASLARHAHNNGYYLRFYTLNGYASQQDMDANGAGAGYNFPSFAAARERWRAAVETGVDFIATDMYEALAAELRAHRPQALLDAWSLEQTVALDTNIHHVQGIDVEDGSLWVSSVDRTSRKGFVSRFELPSGRLVQQVEVQDGPRYHPGGLALHRDSLWIPVAEYMRTGTSVIQRRDKRTLALIGSFPVDDHIGAVAASDTRIVGANWDSLVFYEWNRQGRLLRQSPNPRPVAYQDIKLTRDALIASGDISRAAGAIDFLHPPHPRPHSPHPHRRHRSKPPLHSRRHDPSWRPPLPPPRRPPLPTLRVLSPPCQVEPSSLQPPHTNQLVQSEQSEECAYPHHILFPAFAPSSPNSPTTNCSPSTNSPRSASPIPSVILCRSSLT